MSPIEDSNEIVVEAAELTAHVEPIAKGTVQAEPGLVEDLTSPSTSIVFTVVRKAGRVLLEVNALHYLKDDGKTYTRAPMVLHVELVVSKVDLSFVSPEYGLDGKWNDNLQPVTMLPVTSWRPEPSAEITSGMRLVGGNYVVDVQLTNIVVKDAIADITPGGEADPVVVSLEVNGKKVALDSEGKEIALTLERDPEYESGPDRTLIRPYPYQSKPLSANCTFTPRLGENTVALVVQSKATGEYGVTWWTIEVPKMEAKDKLKDWPNVGHTGGRFASFLVEVLGDPTDILTRKGTCSLTDGVQYEIVEHELAGETRYFLGGKRSENDDTLVPRVFAAPINGKLEAITATIGTVTNATIGTVAKGTLPRYRTTVTFYNNIRTIIKEAGKEDVEVHKVGNEHGWDDVKLVNVETPSTSPDDNVLWVCVVLEGLPEEEAVALDKFDAVVYRTVVNEPVEYKDKFDTSLAGYFGTSALHNPFAEHTSKCATTVEVTRVGNKAVYRGKVEIEPLKPEQGEDSVKEFMIVDNKPSPNTPPRGSPDATAPDYIDDMNGNDGYTLSVLLKKMGYLSRGLAHPTFEFHRPPQVWPSEGEKQINRVTTWNEPGQNWGRPQINYEFVASGGVEKLVATTRLGVGTSSVVLDSGTAWLFPGQRSEADHALVRSPADLVFLGGSWSKPAGGWSGSGARIQPLEGSDQEKKAGTPLDYELDPSSHWKNFWSKATEPEQEQEEPTEPEQEIEWVILISCWGLNRVNGTDGWEAYRRWARERQELGIRGVLGFHTGGWSGRRESATAWLNLADPTYKLGNINGTLSDDRRSLTIPTTETVDLAPGGFERIPAAALFVPGCTMIVGDVEVTVPNGYELKPDGNVSNIPSANGKLLASTTITFDEPFAGNTSVVKVQLGNQRNLIAAWLSVWGGAARWRSGDQYGHGNGGPFGAAVVTAVPPGDWENETLESLGSRQDDLREKNPWYWAVGGLKDTTRPQQERAIPDQELSTDENTWFVYKHELDREKEFKPKEDQP